MKAIVSLINKIQDELVDHPILKKWLHWIGLTILTAISAFVFAFGFRAFISPSATSIAMWKEKAIEANETFVYTGNLISGGASGTSQSLIKLIEIFANVKDYETILVSIFYFCINIPLLVISWLRISKQFTVFTLMNVGLVSLFQALIPDSFIVGVVNLYNNLLARCIFGGICTGIASGIALAIGTCAGGFDIISSLLSNKKGVSTGKYIFAFNSTIIISYVIFSIIGHLVNPSWNILNSDIVITNALYTLIYIFVSTQTIDIINTRNKKVELQICTSNKDLPTILVRSTPHGATYTIAKGAYSEKEILMITVIIAKSEKNNLLKIINKIDPQAFITALEIDNVYGKFYIKPIE